MKPEKVFIKGSKLQIDDNKKPLSELEEFIGKKLSPEYIIYINRFGKGLLSGTIRVYPPEQIIIDSITFRKQIKDFFKWKSKISRQEIESGFLFADSIDGDKLVYLKNLNKYIIIPRHDDEILIAGNTFFVAIDEFLLYTNSENEILYFESFIDRETRCLFASIETLSLAQTTKMIEDFGIIDRTGKYLEHDSETIIFLSHFIEGGIIVFANEDRIIVQLDFDKDKTKRAEQIICSLISLGLTENENHNRVDPKIYNEEREKIYYIWRNYKHLDHFPSDINMSISEKPSASLKRACYQLIMKFEQKIEFNRCPNCNCLVRTPKAKQCFWCNHNWRKSISK